ncbi:thioredoxin family protein, partial [Candidatus Curtissbacteria bacterium]|nr:thioredoxin family protein [Candidatus Curtissbacteria bacterium]
VMIVTALLIFTGYDRVLQAKLLNVFPSYSNLINKFEGGAQSQLDALKGGSSSAGFLPSSVDLSDYGPAPDFVGISKWLNTENPLHIQDLKRKVVLVDFWTYTCINCIRTLPYVTSWYDKYHDQGLVVVGVHTPEFEFEKKTENVAASLPQNKIHYPVAQDNDYKTWDAFSNRYWPAKYLIDAKGVIRYVHFGEGDYDKTEMAIKQLLEEAGSRVDSRLIQVNGDTAARGLTPETYLGLSRLERFDSPEAPKNGLQTFSAKENISKNHFAYEGAWVLADESATASAGSSLSFKFNASKVFLVMSPGQSTSRIKLFLDGVEIGNEVSGVDVRSGVVTLDRQRLYNLVDLKGRVEEHTLKIMFLDGGISVFAFTFG